MEQFFVVIQEKGKGHDVHVGHLVLDAAQNAVVFLALFVGELHFLVSFCSSLSAPLLCMFQCNSAREKGRLTQFFFRLLQLVV
jgi:hypothetical protein